VQQQYKNKLSTEALFENHNCLEVPTPKYLFQNINLKALSIP
jgi:hypothetical protein